MTKEIKLTQNKTALISDEDYDRVSVHRWCYHNMGYATAYIDGTRTLLHRFILDAPKGMDVDHADFNRLNCTRENIRVCSRSQNVSNTKKRKMKATSIYKGVCKRSDRNRYSAQIRHEGILIRLGTFACEHEAARAYNKKALELHKEYTFLNVIEEGVVYM